MITLDEGNIIDIKNEINKSLIQTLKDAVHKDKPYLSEEYVNKVLDDVSKIITEGIYLDYITNEDYRNIVIDY